MGKQDPLYPTQYMYQCIVSHLQWMLLTLQKKKKNSHFLKNSQSRGGGSGGVLPVLNYDSFLYFDLFFVAALPNILLLHIISLRMASPFLLYSQEAMQLVRKNKTIQQDKMRSLETCFLANMLQDYFHNLKKNQVRK